MPVWSFNGLVFEENNIPFLEVRSCATCARPVLTGGRCASTSPTDPGIADSLASISSRGRSGSYCKFGWVESEEVSQSGNTQV